MAVCVFVLNCMSASMFVHLCICMFVYMRTYVHLCVLVMHQYQFSPADPVLILCT